MNNDAETVKMTERSDRKAIIPPSEAAWHAMRVQDITSTESSALFGLSPYATQFELWHRKRDSVQVSIDPNERMEWGTELQFSIAQVLARRNEVQARPIREYVSLNDARMGASFDFEIFEEAMFDPSKGGSIITTMLRDHGPGIFEIKAVDYGVFRENWKVREDNHREAPAHIEIQVQHQMHVRGNKWGAIGVLVGGNKGYVIVRMYDEKVGTVIEQKVRAFWQSIADDVPPPPVFPGDETFITELYCQAQAGKTADLRGVEGIAEIVEQYREAGDREKLGKEDKEIARAKLLMQFGDAARVLVDGGSFDCGITKGGPVSFERKEFRRFKFNARKS